MRGHVEAQGRPRRRAGRRDCGVEILGCLACLGQTVFSDSLELLGHGVDLLAQLGSVTIEDGDLLLDGGNLCDVPRLQKILAQR